MSWRFGIFKSQELELKIWWCIILLIDYGSWFGCGGIFYVGKVDFSGLYMLLLEFSIESYLTTSFYMMKLKGMTDMS